MRRFEEFSAMEDFELTKLGLAYYDLAQYGFTFPNFEWHHQNSVPRDDISDEASRHLPTLKGSKSLSLAHQWKEPIINS